MSARIKRGSLRKCNAAPAAGYILDTAPILLVCLVERRRCAKTWHAHLHFLSSQNLNDHGISDLILREKDFLDLMGRPVERDEAAR